MKSNPVYKPEFANWFFPTLVTISVLVLVVTVYRLLIKKPEVGQEEKFIWLAFWTLVPAFWFSIEYHCIYPTFKVEEVSLDAFKYGQEVTAKFWAAVVTLVGLIAVKKPSEQLQR